MSCDPGNSSHGAGMEGYSNSELGTQRTRALSSAELQSNKSSLRINEITFRSNDHHLLILLDLFPLLCLFAAAAAATAAVAAATEDA